jgi:hypothetical protein
MGNRLTYCGRDPPNESESTDDEDEWYSPTCSTSSPRAITSFFSAHSSSLSLSLKRTSSSLQIPVPDELVDQFLSELEIRFPGTLSSLKATDEIKRADPHGPRLFALRVVRAQKLDVKSAVERAEEHARWRRATLPAGVMALDLGPDVAPHVRENKVFLVLNTEASRPCIIVRVERHTKGLPADLTLYIIYCMELAVYLADAASNPDKKIDVLFDCRGMGWRNYDVSGLKKVFELLEKRFFERIHVIYMYDGPRLLDMLWSVVSPFVDENTRRKVQFVSSKHTHRVMDALGADVMPDDFLGTPIHMLIGRCCWRRRALDDDAHSMTTRTR